MKQYLLILAPLFLLACSKTPSEPQTVTLSVNGMTCENCVQGITGTLSQTPGVIENTVSLETETAVVTYNPDLIDPAGLAKRISQLGFTAEAQSASEQP